MPSSTNLRFGLVVGSLVLALGLEGAVLLSLSQRRPAPVAPSVPAQAPITLEPPVFTAPGSEPPPIIAGAPSPGGKAPNSPVEAAERAAATALQRGDARSAVDILRRAVQQNPKSAELHLNLGVAYLQLKQPDKAVAELRTVTKLAPNNGAAYFQLAQLLLQLRRPTEAVAPLRTAVKLAPQERSAKILLAQVLTLQKQDKAAYDVYATMARSDGRDVEAHIAAASLAGGSLKQSKTADDWLRRAIKANPRDPRPALMLGQVLIGRKQAKAAVQVLNQTAKARPDVFEIYPVLADARLAAGDAKGAINALQSALLRAPSPQDPSLNAKTKQNVLNVNAALHLALGKVYGNTNQIKQARSEFARAAQLAPGDPEATALLARAQLQSGDRAGAIQSLRKSLNLAPKLRTERRLLAQAYASGKQWPQAAAQYALYNQVAPRDAGALQEWAEVLGRAKNYKAALPVLAKLAALDPKNPIPHLQRGAIYRELGQKAQAMAELRTAARLRPRDPNVLLEIAQSEAQSGNYTQAVQSWQRLIEVQPDFAPAYTGLLEAAAKGAQMARARTIAARSLAVDSEKPERIKALTEVLKFYERTDRVADAKALLADIVSRNPAAKSAKEALDSFGAGRPAPSTPEPSSTPSPAE